VPEGPAGVREMARDQTGDGDGDQDEQAVENALQNRHLPVLRQIGT
jgi:hypothetical protein